MWNINYTYVFNSNNFHNCELEVFGIFWTICLLALNLLDLKRDLLFEEYYSLRNTYFRNMQY